MTQPIQNYLVPTVIEQTNRGERAFDLRVLRLYGRKESGEGPVALRQGRDRGRGGPRIGEQRRRRRRDGADALARQRLRRRGSRGIRPAHPSLPQHRPGRTTLPGCRVVADPRLRDSGRGVRYARDGPVRSGGARGVHCADGRLHRGTHPGRRPAPAADRRHVRGCRNPTRRARLQCRPLGRGRSGQCRLRPRVPGGDAGQDRRARAGPGRCPGAADAGTRCNGRPGADHQPAVPPLAGPRAGRARGTGPR